MHSCRMVTIERGSFLLSKSHIYIYANGVLKYICKLIFSDDQVCKQPMQENGTGVYVLYG